MTECPSRTLNRHPLRGEPYRVEQRNGDFVRVHPFDNGRVKLGELFYSQSGPHICGPRPPDLYIVEIGGDREIIRDYGKALAMTLAALAAI